MRGTASAEGRPSPVGPGKGFSVLLGASSGPTGDVLLAVLLVVARYVIPLTHTGPR
ncbi:hypothetical protein ACH4MN_37180 [Streptomyces anulatus]